MTNEERATAIMKGRRANHPHPSDPGMRIVGWVVPEDVAGMSDALFALEEIENQRATIEHMEAHLVAPCPQCPSA